jgi:hypothetical protein
MPVDLVGGLSPYPAHAAFLSIAKQIDAFSKNP